MISNDELHDGMIFILQLRNRQGVASQWMETLREDVAKRWYEIYESSDWEAMRAEAGGVFRNAVSEAQIHDVLKTGGRCIYVHTPRVLVEELRDCAAVAETIESDEARPIAV